MTVAATGNLFFSGEDGSLTPATQVKVDAFSFNEAKPAEDNQVISLFNGGLRAITGLLGRRNKEKVSYVTATIGIRGTNLGAQLDGDGGLHVDVSDGAVMVRTRGERFKSTPGSSPL